MIEIYKIVTGKYDANVSPVLIRSHSQVTWVTLAERSF